MIRKMKEAVCYGATLMVGFLFTLVAAPVIHLCGLDKTDSCPTAEDIDRSRRLAESLKRERAK